MSEHFLRACEHGVVLSQCRCPSTDKVVEVVPCPPSCWENSEEDDQKLAGSGTFVKRVPLSHPCAQPDILAVLKVYGEGTEWMCECGLVWRLALHRYGGHWTTAR